MTQAIVNNLNSIQKDAYANEAKSQLGSSSADSDMQTCKNKYSDFNIIMDKTVCRNNNMIGNANNNVANGDMSDDINKLNDILAKATREVTMENSLDLTLAKDISEIISQLKSACDLVNTNTKEFDFGGIKDLSVIANEETKSNENEDEDKDVSVTVMFGEILKILNSENTTLNNIENSTSEKAESDLQENEINISKITLKEDELKTEIKDLLQESEIDSEILEELKIESISSDANSSKENSFTNKQSPEEYGIKLMLNNIDKSDSGFETQIHTNTVKAQTVDADRLFEQITKQMNSMNGSSKVNIVLNPESLGRLNIQIMNTKDGLTAQFTVTTNEARELLMKGLDGLKENLLTHGIGVDNISVKISEPEESSYNPDWTEQENSEKNPKEQQKQQREEKEKNLFEKTISENLNLENGNV